MPPPRPPDHILDGIRTLRAQGLSYGRIATQLGVTRNVVSGLATRHILGRHHKGGQRKPHHITRIYHPDVWSERYLTEPYAQRKARLLAEKSTIR